MKFVFIAQIFFYIWYEICIKHVFQSAEVLSQLYAALQAGSKTTGVDIESELPAVIDVTAASVLDSYYVKLWALRYASKAACTVLQVDQVKQPITLW